MSDWTKEIDIASQLARTAAQAVLSIYAKDFSVSLKGVNDPVTEADHKANAIIVEGLESHFPEDFIVAEESPLPSDVPAEARVWYVDPLDGTKEFIAKNGEFSIMIGLTQNRSARMGLVYWPTQETLFVGITDDTAWAETKGERRPLQATHAKDPTAFSLVASRSHRSPALARLHETLPIQAEHPMGSVGLKIGFIAQGGADMYTEPGPYTKAWDACAPEAILRGAGGCFTDVHGNPIEYGANNFRNVHGIVGTTRDCHERVIHALTGLCSACDG